MQTSPCFNWPQIRDVTLSTDVAYTQAYIVKDKGKGHLESWFKPKLLPGLNNYYPTDHCTYLLSCVCCTLFPLCCHVTLGCGIPVTRHCRDKLFPESTTVSPCMSTISGKSVTKDTMSKRIQGRSQGHNVSERMIGMSYKKYHWLS